jgi:hypothetical protein
MEMSDNFLMLHDEKHDKMLFLNQGERKSEAHDILKQHRQIVPYYTEY